MNMRTYIITGLVALAVITGLAYLYVKAVPPTVPNMQSQGKESMVPYENAAYDISFQYPSSLYVREVEAGTPDNPQHAIVLVKDTEENRALLDGTSETATEGPTAITIDIYENEDGLSVRDWVQESTNWTVANSGANDAEVAGKQGISYGWSGLYEGTSYVIPYNDRMYVFSVSWLSPDDQIVRDFNMVLMTTVFN